MVLSNLFLSVNDTLSIAAYDPLMVTEILVPEVIVVLGSSVAADIAKDGASDLTTTETDVSAVNPSTSVTFAIKVWFPSAAETGMTVSFV